MVTVTKFRGVVMEKPSGDQGVRRGQHANQSILGSFLGDLGIPAPSNVRRHKLGVSSLSALRLVMMESISLVISSNLDKRALSLMLALIHLSISLLVAFGGALSSNTGRWVPTI